jgi:hypothetical protein
MRKAFTSFVAVAAVAATLAAASTDANARGGAVAAGIIGGLAVGAMIGAGVGRPAYGYPVPANGYVVYEEYGAPYPAGCPDGYWTRRPMAFDAYGQPIAWSRPRFFCPY